jgi:hypothetical protein
MECIFMVCPFAMLEKMKRIDFIYIRRRRFGEDRQWRDGKRHQFVNVADG